MTFLLMDYFNQMHFLNKKICSPCICSINLLPELRFRKKSHDIDYLVGKKILNNDDEI